MRMRAQALLLVLVGILPTALAQPQSGDELRSLVVGFAEGRTVLVAGVPLTSGEWGTDYITVSHGLRVGRHFRITYDGKSYDESIPVTACSEPYHGMDVLVVRVTSHQNKPVVSWGDPADLTPGDQLLALPFKAIQADAEPLKFVHLNLLEWSKDKPEEWPLEWRNVMVATGKSKPGFSGSPWVRDGKVYGLHKGRVRPKDIWFEVAETATMVQKCLEMLHYKDLLPK